MDAKEGLGIAASRFHHRGRSLLGAPCLDQDSRCQPNELAVGRVRCVAVLERSLRGCDLTTGGPEKLLEAGPKKLVFRAGYQDCSLESVHDCFHYTGLRVPAGGSAWFDLGHRSQELKGLSGEIAAEYLTQAPGPPKVVKRRYTNSVGYRVAIRIALSSIGGVGTSIPWLSHLQALVSAVVFHTFGIYLLMSLARGYGLGYEVLVIIIWIACFWLTFPNF